MYITEKMPSNCIVVGHHVRGVYFPNNQGTIPPTSPFSLHSQSPFPLPSRLPPGPSLPSPLFLSCREAAPLKPARGLGSAVSSPVMLVLGLGLGIN